MQLTQASSQWSTRPADQRFWTVEELHAATLAHKESARTATVSNSDLRVEAVEDQMHLVGRTGVPAMLTSWAFNQLCMRAQAPASYLRDLPTTLAAQNLNHGLKANLPNHNETTSVLLHQNGGYFARAVLSEKYTRIWNSDITERLVDLQQQGWTTPPARPANVDDDNTRICTAEQAKLSLTVREGDVIGPAGLYASFEDLFAFMIHPERVIDDGSKGGLMRGFFVWNSEVGKSSWGVMKFRFRGVCGNHIVWDAKDVSEIKVRHVGSADDRAMDQLRVQLKKYADESDNDEQLRVDKAREFILAPDSKKLLDWVFEKGFLSKKAADVALKSVQPEVDGDPLTAWGYAQGITRMSQLERNADKRVALDRAAGKILEVAF
jgi:hypothetical protein